MKKTILRIALLTLGASLHANVVPAPLFTDNAVLQRDKPIPVWGTAAPGESVTVAFAGNTAVATANAAGKWRVDLPARPANSTPADLVIKGRNTVTLANVVVGDVWIASGQSNMEFPVKVSCDGPLDIAASENFPLIRQVRIKKTVADAPASDVGIERSTWQIAGPATTGDFTAVGYFFALDLHQILHVPVGIISSNLGGTPIEAWINPDAYKTVPDEAARVQSRWAKGLAEYSANKAKFEANHAAWKEEQAAAKASNIPFTKREPYPPQGGPGHPHTPSGLYNGMIHPLVPYALRGVIWYQGESNAGLHKEYRALFPAMITGWRKEFGQGDFPFYWVQLANYQSPVDTSWAFLREAQTQTLALPNTGQAVIIDLGNVRDIHPRDKRDVGRRLARLALAREYHQKIPDSGPILDKAVREGTGYRVTFTSINGHLAAPQNTLGGFELAGADKVFKPADAKIENDTVLVSSADVPDPVAVRYAWRNAPLAGLFDHQGLPAAPFRTDDW